MIYKYYEGEANKLNILDIYINSGYELALIRFFNLVISKKWEILSRVYSLGITYHKRSCETDWNLQQGGLWRSILLTVLSDWRRYGMGKNSINHIIIGLKRWIY